LDLFFAGDLLCCREVEQPWLGETLAAFIHQHRLRCVNLEGAWCEAACLPQKKAGRNRRQLAGFGQALEAFNAFALANNHIMDFGADALQQTLEALQQCGKGTFGAALNFDDAYTPFTVNFPHAQVALFAAAEAQFYCLTSPEYTAGYAWVFADTLKQRIRHEKAQGNIVIVQAHAGLENEHLPLPEWRECFRNLIDAGADLIIGHHPHFIQGKEDCAKSHTNSPVIRYMRTKILKAICGKKNKILVLNKIKGTEFDTKCDRSPCTNGAVIIPKNPCALLG
jgi:poly-gamma-glutamate synthesis protein (capsule biosynthesis protein)